MSTLKLTGVRRYDGCLGFSVEFRQKTYTCTYSYQDVCFDELERVYGKQAIDWICFHIIAFEMTKFCSLAPKKISFGALADFCTSAFFEFWQEIIDKIWGQWRYQNNCPDYSGPALEHPCSDKHIDSIDQRTIENHYLLFYGGGKDSLVAMRTLDRHDIDYGSFIYSHSVYGDHRHQLALLKNQLRHTDGKKIHVQRIDDDLMNASRAIKAAEHGQIVHAETPCSVFGALPLMLSKGYRCAVLAHERSADAGNLVWAETGEEINHQWGKSWQAEDRINNYIHQYLVRDFSYFSILKPITDIVIFNLLRYETGFLEKMHSCNVKKPWCKKCAKCAYVWLNLKAYLPNDLIDAIFELDLFDLPENDPWFRQMLGLAEHTPFECVGQVSEARLALELYLQTNDHPKARQLREEFNDDFPAIVCSMTTPTFANSNLDAGLSKEFTAYYETQTEIIREHLLDRLNDPFDHAVGTV